MHITRKQPVFFIYSFPRLTVKHVDTCVNMITANNLGKWPITIPEAHTLVWASKPVAGKEEIDLINTVQQLSIKAWQTTNVTCDRTRRIILVKFS